MAAQITSPLELFLDSDGTPLEDGYIYIGTQGLNAETNPITVYWDDAYSIAASQPIRTIGGYASNGGIKSNIFVSGFYSIVVKDKNGVLVFSGDSILDPNIALGVSQAQLEVWNAEAEALTAESYATQIEDVFVDTYTSNGDGTFTATPTTDYSSLHWAAKSALSTATSGQYTPTITDIGGNIASTGTTKANYIRVGDYVNVSGYIQLTPTAASTVVFEISLPFATIFTGSGTDGSAGNFAVSGTGVDTGRIYSVNAQTEMRFFYTANTTTQDTLYFTFGYKVQGV